MSSKHHGFTLGGCAVALALIGADKEDELQYMDSLRSHLCLAPGLVEQLATSAVVIQQSVRFATCGETSMTATIRLLVTDGV